MGVFVVVSVVMFVAMIVMVMMVSCGASAGGAHIESPEKIFSTEITGS
jgi:hypothetical protein